MLPQTRFVGSLSSMLSSVWNPGSRGSLGWRQATGGRVCQPGVVGHSSGTCRPKVVARAATPLQYAPPSKPRPTGLCKCSRSSRKVKTRPHASAYRDRQSEEPLSKGRGAEVASARPDGSGASQRADLTCVVSRLSGEQTRLSSLDCQRGGQALSSTTLATRRARPSGAKLLDTAPGPAVAAIFPTSGTPSPPSRSTLQAEFSKLFSIT